MSLKDRLEILKLNFLRNIPINRDYEFYANLENHPIGDQNIYRLYYINYHRIGEEYGQPENNIGIVERPFQPFKLPESMSREDAFKILSYLTDFIENKLNLKPCSYKSVSVLDEVLKLERLGFQKNDVDNINEIIDLYTISGRVLLFKQSLNYQKYFEWYTENVAFEEVRNIYTKYGIDFYDLSPEELKATKDKTRSLKNS